MAGALTEKRHPIGGERELAVVLVAASKCSISRRPRLAQCSGLRCAVSPESMVLLGGMGRSPVERCHLRAWATWMSGAGQGAAILPMTISSGAAHHASGTAVLDGFAAMVRGSCSAGITRRGRRASSLTRHYIILIRYGHQHDELVRDLR